MVPPPPLLIPSPLNPPPPLGGGTVTLAQKASEILGTEGAKADLHCDTMVQICGAPPPPQPPGEEQSLCDRPRSQGGEPA